MSKSRKYQCNSLPFLVHRDPQAKWGIFQDFNVYIYCYQFSKGISFSLVIGRKWNDFMHSSWICGGYDELFIVLICKYDTHPHEWVLFRDTHYEKIHHGYKPKSLKKYINLEKRTRKIIYNKLIVGPSSFPFKNYNKYANYSFKDFSSESYRDDG